MNGNLGAAIVTVLIFGGLGTFIFSQQIDMCHFLKHCQETTHFERCSTKMWEPRYRKTAQEK